MLNKMKKRLSLILCAIMLVGILAACGETKTAAPSADATPAASEAAAPEYTIKMAHGMMENTPQHQGALEFQRLVSEKTGGKVEVVIYPAGQMGSDTELAEMLQTDAVDAAIIPTAKLSGFYAPPRK